jgi:hypothetical protein
MKFDSHVTEVRELEKRIQRFASAQCQVPTDQRLVDHVNYWDGPSLGIMTNEDAWRGAADLQPALIAAAFACDLTRVAHLALTPPPPGVFGGDDPKADVHQEYAHHQEEDPHAKEMMTLCHITEANVVANLVQKLKDAGVWDGTLVVWVGELATGEHAFKPWPAVLVGSAGGFLKTGQVVRAAGTSHVST